MTLTRCLMLMALIAATACSSNRQDNQARLDAQAKFFEANPGMAFIIAPASLDSYKGTQVIMSLASKPGQTDTLKNVMAFTQQTYAWPLNYSVQNIGGYELEGWNAAQPVTFAPAAGEIVYAGHIVLVPHYSIGSEKYIDIRVEDRWEEYRRQYKLPPSWEGKVQKRLLQMPARVKLVISQTPRP